MDLQELIGHSRTIEIVVEGAGWELDETIDAVVESGDWDLAARLLVSAADIPARQLAKKLLAKEAYAALAIGACFRRQPRRPGEGAGGGGIATRVFRDVDAEDGSKGVPDYIQADIQEMAKTAAQTRSSAMSRDAVMDRDPIRQYIVDNLSPKMATSEMAMDAMIAIARASAWEETRRTAALKVANDQICVGRLARDGRIDDIEAVSRMALLEAVAETFAREMGKSFQSYVDAKNSAALRYIAEHHSDPKFKDSAGQWADAVEKPT